MVITGGISSGGRVTADNVMVNTGLYASTGTPIATKFGSEVGIGSSSTSLSVFGTSFKYNNNNLNNAGGLVQLDSSGKLPAVDGSQLTNLPGGSTDITSFYQLDYGTETGSIPVTFSNNNITIKSGIPITTPNGTFQYTSDVTYEYNFETERTIFAYKDDLDEDYYNMVAVYYGGSQPATNPKGQIAWFDNNVWKMISATGEITTFSTQLITPIAKVYLNGNNVKSIDYASYYKIDISNPTPANMVTTDTNQIISGVKDFSALFKINKGISLRGSITARDSIDGINPTIIDYKNGDGNIILGEIEQYTHSSMMKNVGIEIRQNNISNDAGLYAHKGTDVYPLFDSSNIPTGALKYWTGTETEYTGLTTKNADTLYRTTDTNKVYLGTIQLGG